MSEIIYKSSVTTLPIEPGWQYWVSPNVASNNWVEVDRIEGYGRRTIVYATGLHNTSADWAVQKYRFDDLVVAYIVGGFFLITEDELFDITDEQGADLLGA